MGGLINMERKGCESIIHNHDRDLWVTMVEWLDVPDSDWGDFRCRHAIDISSYWNFHHDRMVKSGNLLASTCVTLISFLCEVKSYCRPGDDNPAWPQWVKEIELLKMFTYWSHFESPFFATLGTFSYITYLELAYFQGNANSSANALGFAQSSTNLFVSTNQWVSVRKE